jgi:choline dehydrogenase-like flavoprotein
MIDNCLPPTDQPWDICVVGSGPVGMAIAMELDRLGQEVLVLESGGAEADPKRADDSRAILVNSKTHAPMEIATCRAFGGTSWTWGGRSVPFDDIDLASRPWVPHSDWPISHDELRAWYPRAAEYLLCGNGKFRNAPDQLPAANSDLNVDALERWASQPRLALIHRARIESSRRITLCLNSTVVDIEFDEASRSVAGLVVAGPAGRSVVRARRFVLAMGGVETTRLLLAVQRRRPELFGGPDGPLGRFYMGHISGKIADIVLARKEYAGAFDFERDSTGCWIRRRLALSDAAQREHQLLNIVFWPDNAPFYDYRHRSGVLSGVFLALSFPPTGRKLLSEGIRLAHIGSKPRRYGQHLWNVVVGAPAGALDIYRILHDRFFSKPAKPGFLVRTRSGKYALHYHGEQEPNPESRIVLSGETDRFGLPRASVDLRFTTADIASVVKSHQALDRALQASGIARLDYRWSEDQLANHVWAQASDGYHQAGTTRMGTDARSSVVDPDLTVHGVVNLFVASSSVFPTTGQANSTFPAVALGMRLVHEQLAGSAANSGSQPAAAYRSPSAHAS